MFVTCVTLRGEGRRHLRLPMGYQETPAAWEDAVALQVSSRTRQAASACTKDFACLSGRAEHVCPVECCVDGRVHFIKCLHHTYCSFQQAFGEGLLCTCPVRKELYNAYGV